MVPHLDLPSLFNALVPVADQAGAVVMDVYEQAIAVQTKADQSPVTAADQKAEDVIVAALQALTPEFPIIAEEAVAQGKIPDIGSGPFWLVDPLDGTKEFIQRNGEFTVNIGLVVDGIPVFGVVYAPAVQCLYAGWEGGGSRRRVGQGAFVPISCRVPHTDQVTVLASRSHTSAGELEAWLQAVPHAQVMQVGSSLKFCRVAEGSADVYPRFGPTSEWDTCAGHAVLKAAGGCVVDLDGQPLTYGKPDLKNGPFVARGQG